MMRLREVEKMNKLNMKENWPHMLCILVGIAITIVGIVFLEEYNKYGGYYHPLTFGADFYTEMHEVAANIATALHNIYEMARVAFGWFLIGVGLTEIIVFAGKLRFPKKEESSTDSGEKDML